MARFLPKLAFLIAATAACTFAQAGSSEADAKKLLEKAVDYFKANGYEKGVEECNNLSSPFNSKSDFNQGDMYLFMLTYEGLQNCHGKNPKIKGKNTISMKDQNGVEMIKEMATQCKAKGNGQVDYVWPDAVSKALVKKRAFVLRIPGKDECVGTGISLPG